MRPLKNFIPRSVRHALLGWAARVGFAIGRVLPRKLGLALFSFLGMICYYVLREDRRRTVDNLRSVFGGEWDDGKIRAVSRAVFKSLGKNLFDAVNLERMGDKKFDSIVSHDSLEALANARDRGKGILAITAHVGCFEMLLHFVARKGFKSFAIGRAFNNHAVDDVVRKMRSGENVEYMDRSESNRKIVRMLREGKIFGVLVDQDTNVEGVFADFLGRSAFTPSGAVRFAMKFDIPIFVFITERMPKDKHHVFISDELTYVDTGDFEADLASNMQRINDFICSYIRKYPKQWVWMHERWKTRPVGEGGYGDVDE